MGLPYINLPDYFVRLLQANMHHTETGYQKLKNQMWQEGPMQILLHRCFKDYDMRLGPDRLIALMGWHGMRNKLASFFIHYSLYGRFPLEPQLELVEDVLNIEDKLAPYTVDGYSRGFLFGFYMKLGYLQLKELYPNKKFHHMEFDQAIVDLLKTTRTKTVKIDWLLVLLKSLQDCVGVDELKNHLSAGHNYQSIFKALTVAERNDLNKDLLSYGASIGEIEMFSDVPLT